MKKTMGGKQKLERLLLHFRKKGDLRASGWTTWDK